MLREEVTAEDVSEIVSRWTGIPVQVSTARLVHCWPGLQCFMRMPGAVHLAAYVIVVPGTCVLSW